MEDLVDVLELLGTAYFLTGVRLGLVALAVGWALRFALGRDKPPIPIGGILIAAAIVGTLARVQESVTAELPALGLMLLASLLARVFRAPLWVHPIVVLPGAIWFALATPVTELYWVRVLMMVMIPVGGFLITDFSRRHASLGLGVIFYTLAVLGAFAAVPDTEWAVALVAVSVPITFLAWPRAAVSIGTEGAYLAVAVFLWVVAHGGAARPPSIIGSVACLGLLFLEPVLIALKPSAVKLTTWFNHSAPGAVVASVPQFVVMVLCSRVAARFSTFPPAIIVVVIVYAATIVLGVYAGEKAMRADEERYDEDPEDRDDFLPGSLTDHGIESGVDRAEDPWA
ncbi:MAG: hypothetical protein ACRDWS_13075 [Acidimicrobiia bacterium]